MSQPVGRLSGRSSREPRDPKGLGGAIYSHRREFDRDSLIGSRTDDMIQFMPKSFENGVLNRQPINQGLVQSVRLIGEYRGKQALFKQQSPQVLEALRENAVIQSTESSNRIEGVVAPLERIRD